MNEEHIKVLLIEDNPGDARIINEMLAEAKGVHFYLECTNRLSPGLNRISTGGIDVILSDLSLPDSQGLDTFAKVHARAPSLPIVVLSSLDDEELAVKAVQEGAQDYLVKGHVDSNLLTRSIRYAIERKLAEEQLIQSEKLAGIGMLASGIAHEVNNPLTGIVGYAEILMNGDNPENTRKYAEKIMKEAMRTANIVRWLSNYSRQAKDSNITNLYLSQVIEESLEALKHTRRSYDIEIVKNYQKNPIIKGNRSELQQVFVNLMNNAVDAMPNGGKLNLSTVIKDRWVEAKVSDNGKGIPKDKINRIFEPFYTTKEVGEGTGLGLYVTSMIVKKHHGAINVYSEIGKGTTFILSFPISEVTT
jgi:sigma-B regulation protein RsbU (phosphoserine phosphatase)